LIAEILSTGDEIRTGALIDSNSAYIAETLQATGVFVSRHLTVGDDVDAIEQALKEIANRADVALVTGGLGPTVDDLTPEAASRAAGVSLVLDRAALTAIEGFFQKMGRPMSDSNRKQAMLPEGALRLDNPIGTAPGFMLYIGACRFFFLPGVPTEMRRMLAEQVLPRLSAQEGGNRRYYPVRTISTFGLPESVAGERLVGLTEEFPEITLGLRAKFPEIQIKLYAEGDDETRAHDMLERASEWVARKMERHVFSTDGSPMEAVVGRLLRKQKATLGVAESCTGGLISHWLTEVPGSSDYFLFSAVTYSNEAKIRVLGVEEESLLKFGAVHEEIVRQMAHGVRRVSGAAYGLATSGIAGPDGGTDEKPVGTVCIGLATPEKVEARRLFFPFGDRTRKKQMFAMTALNLLRRELLGDPVELWHTNPGAGHRSFSL